MGTLVMVHRLPFRLPRCLPPTQHNYIILAIYSHFPNQFSNQHSSHPRLHMSESGFKKQKMVCFWQMAQCTDIIIVYAWHVVSGLLCGYWSCWSGCPCDYSYWLVEYGSPVAPPTVARALSTVMAINNAAFLPDQCARIVSLSLFSVPGSFLYINLCYSSYLPSVHLFFQHK